MRSGQFSRLFQYRLHRLGKLGKSRVGAFRPSNNYVIAIIFKIGYQRAKNFSQSASDFVPNDRFPYLFAYNKAYFERILRGRIDKRKPLVGRRYSLLAQIVEYPTAFKPVFFLHSLD